MTPDPRPVLSPARVAAELGVTYEAAITLMRSGQLRAVNKGRKNYHHWRTSEAWLEEFKAGRRGQTVGSNALARSGRVRSSPVIGLEWAGAGKSRQNG